MTLSQSVLSFAVVAALLTIVPGLDTAIVLRTALVQGKRCAFATALGVNTGVFVWGAGAALGVAALLNASAIAYSVLRIAGAAYMILLGLKMLWSAAVHHPAGGTSEHKVVAGSWIRKSEVNESDSLSCWRRGLFTNLFNPKVGAFYIAMLAQFIPAGSSHLAIGLLLAAIHNIEGLIWFSLIIAGTHLARNLLDRRHSKRAIEAVTGSVLVGFGLKLGLGAQVPS